MQGSLSLCLPQLSAFVSSPVPKSGRGLPDDLQLHSHQAIVSADRFKRAVLWELLILNKDQELVWVKALLGEGIRRAWKIGWIPEVTLLDKLEAECCLERHDKISGDRGIKGSAASEIPLKYFSYHLFACTKSSFFNGNNKYVYTFTKIVISGHYQSLFLFHNWG